MTSNNTWVDNLESGEKSKQKSSLASVREFLSVYIQENFANPKKRITLIDVLKLKDKDWLKSFLNWVSDSLSRINGEWSPYAELNDEDFSKISLLEIQSTILRESVEWNNQISSIKRRIFSEWSESSFTSEQLSSLDTLLQSRGKYDLKKLIWSRGDRLRLLKDPSLGNISNLRTVDFDDTCRDLGIGDPTPEQQKTLANWIAWKKVSEVEISKLLSSLVNYTTDQKQRLIEYFSPTVSLMFLREHNIITNEEATEYAKIAIKEAYPDLSDDQVEEISDAKTIKKWLQNDTLRIEIKNLRSTHIEAWFLDKKALKSIAETIESDLILPKGIDTEEWDLERDKDGKYKDSFIKETQKRLIDTKTGRSYIPELENLDIGSVLRFSNRKTGKAEYYRVLETDAENEERHEGMMLQLVAQNGKSVLWSPFFSNYQEVRDQLISSVKEWEAVRILDEDTYESEKTQENIEPLPETDPELTLDRLISLIDESDKEGTEYGLKEGNTISLKDDESGEIELITIKNIDPIGRKITLIEQYTNEVVTGSFDQILRLFTQFGCKRQPAFSGLETFVQNIGIAGLIASGGLKMLGGKHGNDEVGVQALKTWDGKAHVIIKKSDQDGIVFEEYAGSEKIEKEQKDDLPPKLLGKKHKYYKARKMSYLQFAAFVKNTKLNTALEKTPLDHNDSYTDEAPYHTHRWVRKWLMGMTNIGEVWWGLKMAWHSLEHTLEKGQKINEAKFMYRLFGKFDGDFGSQVVADYVEAVGDTIEKIRKKINGFNNGMKKRKKCLHLLEDTSSKPEEIAAALLVTVESSGGLYSDIPFSGYAGSWMWFNALVRAAWYSDPARIKAELADKVNEVNAENPTEEMYIEQFLKKYGELYNNPLLMAMGGYPKFRNTLIEWRKKEIEKGERDGDELLGIDDTVQLAKNKMNTLELPQVVGIYKSAMSKYAWGNADVIPWMWALSNAATVAHPNVAKEFKNFTDEQGFTFHAIPFCRNPEKSALYKRVVSEVVREKIGTSAHSEFEELQKKIKKQLTWHHHRSEKELEEYNAEIMKWLAKFWWKYQEKLHPILQGTSDSYILEKAWENSDFKAYIQYLDETHGYRGSAGKEWFNKDYWYVDGYASSPSFGYTEVNNSDGSVRYVRDIKRELEWIDIGWHRGGAIENDLDTHLFQKSIIKFLKNDISKISDPEQKKATYIENYKAILAWIREHLASVNDPSKYQGMLWQKYMQSLMSLWMDLGFETVIENNTILDPKIKWERDEQAALGSYQNYINGHRWWVDGTVTTTRSRFLGTTENANDTTFPKTGTWGRWGYTRTYNPPPSRSTSDTSPRVTQQSALSKKSDRNLLRKIGDAIEDVFDGDGDSGGWD
jgi:hypothetical protein